MQGHEERIGGEVGKEYSRPPRHLDMVGQTCMFPHFALSCWARWTYAIREIERQEMEATFGCLWRASALQTTPELRLRKI